MQAIDSVQYVRHLELREPEAAFPLFRDLLQENFETTSTGVEQAFLNAKSLVSFVSQVTAERRQDVLDTVLIAQLAANKQFPGEEAQLDWYRAFTDVLENLGWVMDSREFSSFEANQDVFEMENAIIDILTKAFGGAFKAIIMKTLGAIKNLSDSDHKIKVFEMNTHTMSKGAFQIGLVSEENGTVSMQLGTFLLTSTNQIRRILFFKSSKDHTRLDYASSKGTLNESLYSTVRQTVQARLGQKSREFVTRIDI